jgi:hypothetical protein
MTSATEAPGTVAETVVTVIVPTYLAETYLDECLASVLDQTHRALQVLVVDDGSPDASAEIACRWAVRDPRVEVIRIPHGGAAAARNTGLEAAVGDYITFVDADDVVHASYVGDLLAAARATGADLVVSGLSQYPDGGEPTYRAPTSVRTSAPDAVLERIVTSGVGFSSCGKLMRADLVAGVRYRSGLPFEDLGVLPTLFGSAELVAETDAIGYGYRRHADSTEGGHQRVLKTDLLRVLALNIADARARHGSHTPAASRLVVGYALQAAKALEGQINRDVTRERDFDHTYRQLLRDAMSDVRRSGNLSLAYKAALGLSSVWPSGFVAVFGLARRLKATVIPQLRRG